MLMRHLPARIRAHAESRARLRLAGLVSLGLHAVLIGGAVLWYYHREHLKPLADTEGAVELVLVERQGANVTTAPPAPAPEVAAPAAPPQPEQPPAPPMPETDTADEALPLPPVPPSPPAGEPSQPSPPVRQALEAPEIHLGGTDDETNAIVTGPNVIPAGLDAKFRNREPVYPLEAARRAEQGAVILLIHVSPEGVPTDVAVAQSSGYVLLDNSARDAVMSWHFLPAVRDGQPIPFNMQFRVVFHLE
jgi:periplasmic protein TonB